jgi:hypothetical protein
MVVRRGCPLRLTGQGEETVAKKKTCASCGKPLVGDPEMARCCDAYQRPDCWEEGRVCADEHTCSGRQADKRYTHRPVG